MNGFDVALAGLAGVLVLVGLLQGMTRLLIGIGAAIAAFVLAARLHEPLAARLGFLASGETARAGIAFAAILLGTLVAGAVVAWLARRMLKAVGLSWLDRVAGAVLGLIAALLLAAIVALPLVAYSSAGREMLERSRVAPYVTVVADLASRLLPQDPARSYRRHVEELRERWHEAWRSES
jgi:membrane protein required for colicin V production